MLIMKMMVKPCTVVALLSCVCTDGLTVYNTIGIVALLSCVCTDGLTVYNTIGIVALLSCVCILMD